MFSNACRFYWDLVCNVGGGSPTIEGKLHGKGCLLSPNYAITALHTVTKMLQQYKWPLIMKSDGVFKCDVVLQSSELDIALLKTTEKIKDIKRDQPLSYPTIASSNPSLGLSVGFIGVVTLEGETKNERHTTFSQASTSYFFLEEQSKGLRYALTGGFIQQGFSGGPVFAANSELIGLLVMAQRFALDMEHPLASIYNIPVMSPLAPLKKDIDMILSSK
jgi:S1-C subfamily serine protease